MRRVRNAVKKDRDCSFLALDIIFGVYDPQNGLAWFEKLRLGGSDLVHVNQRQMACRNQSRPYFKGVESGAPVNQKSHGPTSSALGSGRNLLIHHQISNPVFLLVEAAFRS